MKKCVTSEIIAYLPDGSPASPADKAAFAREHGFEEFDLMMTAPEMLADGYEAAFAARVEAVLGQGIGIKYAHIPFDYPAAADDAEAWERFSLATLRAIDMVNACGADCAAIHPRTYMKEVYDKDREHDAAVEFLTPFAEYAVKKGVKLALENGRGPGAYAPHRVRRFGCEADEFLAFAEEMDMGICWDTGHANLSLNDQLRSLTKAGGRLLMVHINDNNADDDRHLAPFLGNVDWEGVAKGLAAAGYNGSMNLEVNCKKRPAEVRSAYADYMSASAGKLIEMTENYGKNI